MNIYLVDFENVNSQGLNGINRLDSSDRIIIFYSENADSMTFELHEQINQSKAYIYFQKVDVGTKNALDFQLATYLGYLICENEKAGVAADYFVVTKDRGYSSLITYWTKRNVDITLVGTLIQSMRIQRERSEERRKAAEGLGSRAVENPKSRGAGLVSANAAAAQAAVSTQEVSDNAAAAEVPAAQEAIFAAGQEAVPEEAEEAPDAETGAETAAAAGADEAGDVAAGAEETADAEPADTMSAEEAGIPVEELPDADRLEMTQAACEAENIQADEAAQQESGMSGETSVSAQQQSDRPSDEGASEEKPVKRTRGRGRTKAEPAVDTELRIKVEQAVPDKDVVDLVVSYIKKYKTKLGINNALAKEFKDSKKASEIYKSIKPLIADKKGQ